MITIIFKIIFAILLSFIAAILSTLLTLVLMYYFSFVLHLLGFTVPSQRMQNFSKHYLSHIFKFFSRN